MQVTLRGLVYAAAATVYGTDTSGEPAWPDHSTRNIMAMGQALADVATVRHADDDGRLTMRNRRHVSNGCSNGSCWRNYAARPVRIGPIGAWPRSI